MKIMKQIYKAVETADSIDVAKWVTIAIFVIGFVVLFTCMDWKIN